ncbi:MAG: lysylphosphatidylglycerol synthase transmembrane domain-containing protein [Thermoleophilia bacterium]
MPRVPGAVARRVATVAGLAVVAWFAATHVDWAEIADAMRGADPRWLAAAFALNLVSLMIRGAGWTVAARAAVDRPLGAVPAGRAFLIGQAVNTVVPGRVGELAKCAVAQRHLDPSGPTFTALLGSVFAHRLMDVVPLSLATAFVLVFGDLPGSLRNSVIVTLAVSAVAIAAAVRFAASGRFAGSDRRALRLLDGLRQGFLVLRRGGPLGWAALLETVGWGVQIGVVWLGTQGFGLDAGAADAATVVIATNAATLIPLWPGNIGLFQVAVAVALDPAGVPRSAGIAYGLALQGIEAGSALLGGAVSAAAEGLRPGELRDMAAAVPEDGPAPPMA